MTATEILQRDAQRNHNNLDPAVAQKNLEIHLNTGSILTRHGNTLFLSKKLPDAGVEFHTINADSAQNLLHNTHAYLNSIRAAGAQYAVCPYSNSRVTDLFFELLALDDDLCIGFRTRSDSLFQATIHWEI